MLELAGRFALQGSPTRVAPLGGGLINQTFRVTTDGGVDYVLQRLNRGVFPRPDEVMENIWRVTRHLARVSDRIAVTLVETDEGACWLRDSAAEAWRCYRFVPEARAWSQAPDARTAMRAAEAFGRFSADLSDLDPADLHEVLPGFHDTPARLAALEIAAETDACGRVASAARWLEGIRARGEFGAGLEQARRRGELRPRVVHNDTKLNNVLFHRVSNRALCVVDLDTVMPGLLVHDFGDLVRSAAAVGQGAALRLDMRLVEALLAGYRAGAGSLLGPADRCYLALAPRVLALELAARFLTDYLEGDRYFRTAHPGENLLRCQGQLALLADMERQAHAMHRLIEAG